MSTQNRLGDPQGSIDKALDLLLDPVTGSKAKGRKVLGVLTIHVDDVFMTGDDKFAKLILDKLAKDFKIGHLDKDDVEFVGQRVKVWKTKGGRILKISVDQEKKIEELSEIEFNSSLRDDITCNPDLHKQFRSVLGQINWLQSRTQYQSCYSFSRSASSAAGPNILYLIHI